MQFTRLILKCSSLEGLEEFYCGLLGMRNFGSAKKPLFGYGRNQCLLEFIEAAPKPYVAGANDFYWKIGLTLDDLDSAFDWLAGQGTQPRDRKQFRDIGYMAKLTDPQGFIVELLQRGFAGNEQPVGEGHPIGAQASLAHITFRVTDMAAAKHYCENTLAMRLMSVQGVHDLGFCLYFYGWSDEQLPNADLEAVKNREWLWARPYTMLELQHLEAPGSAVAMPGEAGFDGFEYGDERGRNFVTLEEMVGMGN